MAIAAAQAVLALGRVAQAVPNPGGLAQRAVAVASVPQRIDQRIFSN
ncbi:MAG: hypothetical protein PHI97_11625 [Desulfobulbus sp.]|nr:hypothetical protein [Desulfobulbus sp.]